MHKRIGKERRKEKTKKTAKGKTCLEKRKAEAERA